MDRKNFIRNASLLSFGVLYGPKLFSQGKSLVKSNGPFSPDPLGYDYVALEPYIDARTMEIHYSKHYKAYIDNLNKALPGSGYENHDIVSIIRSVEEKESVIRNNAGGYYNHSLFWKSLSPNQGKPSEKLERAIVSGFGSLEAFKNAFSKAALGIFGSGWVWLVLNKDKQLSIVTTANQDNPLMKWCPNPGIPLLELDIWEHAYYLKYQNRRKDYVASFWNVVNWKEVNKNYDESLENSFFS